MEAINNLKELNPGDGGEFLKEIVNIYLEDTPKRIVDLKTYLASGDVKSFTRAAHTIKGSSANVGAQILKSIGERMELISRTEGILSIAPMIVSAEEEFAKVEIELRRLAP
ncbi:MAG TPA: Hpt domain-containing protein [Opitutaceae bacterium]|jgi:HPt (histidine-containing phosphotransfer) domain-containing protein|nr:Hpt domain-containing protein [Opitutaceae bacterium]